ncbi:MAG: dipeptidase [Parvibaculum sp.]
MRLPLFVIASVVALVGFPIWLASELAEVARHRTDAASTPDAAFHARLLTLDSHVDIPPTYTQTEAHDPGLRTELQVDLPKMDEGGLDAAFFIVYVGQSARNEVNDARAKVDALVKFDAIHRMTDELYANQIGLALRPADVSAIHETGRKVAMIGIENGYVIGRDLSLLQSYFDQGARYMTLAHVGHNDLADSSMPRMDLGDKETEHDGLSALGRDAVREMNRLGMMVDVSHISDDAMMEATALSQAPVIASHSATRALADHPRNMSDDQLQAIASRGGVVQMVAFSTYVKADPGRIAASIMLRNRIAQLRGVARFSYLAHGKLPAFVDGMAEIDRQFPRATLSDFVDHIDHAVRVMGIDHVGISSDFDGGGGVVGWDDASETGNVTAELLRRGYVHDDIQKLWSGNLLRVWSEVEAVARRR